MKQIKSSPPLKPSIKTSSLKTLPSRQLLPDLLAGLITGLVTLTFGLSYTALIFAGDLTQYLPLAIGIALVGAALTAMIVALRSSIPFAIAGPDAHASAILAAVATAIVGTLATRGNRAALFPTTAVAIIVGTALTGFGLFILGRLRLGRWIRFIPYPVMGGFLAGTGWLITYGAFRVMTGLPLTDQALLQLAQVDALRHWLPGLALALVLLNILNRYRHFLILPGVMVGAIVLFHAGWWLTNLFQGPVNPQGWFLEPFSTGQLLQLWNPAAFAQVDWAVLAEQSKNLVPLIAVVAIAILLNASGIEVTTQVDVDLDKELRANGVANVATGLCGGMIGYLSLSRTLLNHQARASRPLAGMVAGLVCVGMLLFGGNLLAFFPKPILGGLLLFLGLNLLVEWVYRSWFKLPHIDYAVVLIILIFVATVGFLWAIGAGIIIGCILFAVNYSQTRVIKHVLSGVTYRSNVSRSLSQQAILEQKGDRLCILPLQGYLFFGTANLLFEKIRQRAEDLSLPPLQFLLLDFRLVHGLDSSAVLSFVKLRQMGQKRSFKLVLTNLQPTIAHQLQRGGCLDAANDDCRTFPDIDRGLEWCEDQLIGTTLAHPQESSLLLQLEQLLPTAEQAALFSGYLEQLNVPESYTLFHQGDPPGAIFFVESGQLTVIQEMPGGQTRRLQTIHAGTIVGEIAFFRQSPRSATVVTNQSSSLYCLSKEAWRQMQQENLATAAEFQQAIIRLLTDRVIHSDHQIKDLLV